MLGVLKCHTALKRFSLHGKISRHHAYKVDAYFLEHIHTHTHTPTLASNALRSCVVYVVYVRNVDIKITLNLTYCARTPNILACLYFHICSNTFQRTKRRNKLRTRLSLTQTRTQIGKELSIFPWNVQSSLSSCLHHSRLLSLKLFFGLSFDHCFFYRAYM